MIDCELQLVRVWTPSAGELVIHGEGAQCGPTLCSAARARCYLRQGYFGFVAFLMDSREKGEVTIGDVLIV